MQLQKFVDRLPIPGVLEPSGQRDGIPYYKVTMEQFKQKLHRDLPPTTLWGYEGVYPGPTIEVERNKPIKIKWKSTLPADKSLLPVDTTVHGADMGAPLVRTVVHLHGGKVEPDSDGFPEAWFTQDYQQTGPYFKEKVYDYPNRQQAAALWYHDHALGITRLNVYAGLAGFYLVRDAFEASLGLPKGRYEVPLVIQDRSFNPDGSLYYPSQPSTPPSPNIPDPSIVPEFFGDTILVNGKVWPYLEVEPRKYRLRLLNGSNSRFYRLNLMAAGGGQKPSWVQIGTDQGFLEAAVVLDSLTLSPAERADVIIDFTGLKGGIVRLTNDAPSPFPDGQLPDPETTGSVMEFRVTLPSKGEDTSNMPHGTLKAYKYPEERDAVKIRRMTLVESADEYGRPLMLLDNMHWDHPVTETPVLGSTEIWEFINLTMDTHPIHLHLVHFLVLNRQPFDVSQYQTNGNLVFLGDPVPAEPNERGPKDTVRAAPGEVTRIIARFVPYEGLYVWHCHILEHEDYDMMRPYKVIGRGGNKQ